MALSQNTYVYMKQWKLPEQEEKSDKKWESMNIMRTWRQTVEGDTGIVPI